MKKIVILIFLILFLVEIVSASTWVNNPSDCPTSAQSQTCSGSDVVCGLNGGITYCYNPSSLIPPSSSANSTTSYSSSFDGGYILDCDSYDGSAPNCDNSGNFWCDRSETCYSTAYRNTLCTADTWETATCGTCRTGYFDCYGDTNCESTSTSDCQGSNNNHYSTGTCNTDLSGGASGTCVCDTNYYACDGSETDLDGCEIHTGSSCSLGTGTYSGSCYGSVGECTSSTNSDCNNDDSDSNIGTCNGADGCEIISGASCGNGTGTYASHQCIESSGNCTSSGTRLDCNNDDSDSNTLTCNGADGCEVTDGGACTVGTLQGTYDGCSCVVTQSNFKTGDETSYSTDNALLWGSQYGTGYLMNFTNGTDIKFGVNNSGCVVFPDGTTQCTGTLLTDFTNVAYINQSNNFSENQDFSSNITVEDTGSFGFLGSLVNRITKLFVIDIDASGNVSIGEDLTVGTNTLVVDSNNNRVGIVESNPSTTLDVNGGARFSGTTSNVEGELVYNNVGGYYQYYNGTAWVTLTGGDATFTGTLWSQDGNNIFYNDGSVGMGVTAPTQKLDVNGNLNISGYYYGDGSQLTNISTYNSTYDIWAYNQTTPAMDYTDEINLSLSSRIDNIAEDNSSWNESYADTKYANISWNYNQTTPAMDYTDEINLSLSSRIDNIAEDNSSWNESYADTKYANISWNYNQTTPAMDYSNSLNNSLTTWVSSNYLLTSIFDSENISIWNAINSGFNQSLADVLYYSVNNPSNYINKTNLSEFTDDLGSRGYDSLSNFTNDLDLSAYNQTDLALEINLSLSSRIDNIAEDNSSWNESYADTKYANISWNYNQTTPAMDYIDSVISDDNDSWSSTYNSTYDTKADYQFTNNNFNGSGNIETTGSIGIGTTASANSRIKVDINNPSGPAYTIIEGYTASTRILSSLVLTTNTSRGKGILMEDTQYNETWYTGTPYFSRNYQIGYYNAALLYDGNGGGENASDPLNAYMTITTSGSVGIGTISPTQKLDVNGNVNISGYYYGDGSQLTNISTYNSTYDIWAYNQTTPAMDYIDSVISDDNDSWSSTYNSTYDIWAYNQTTPTMDYIDSVISDDNNSWTSTYNSTYDI
ncbi:MAG: hypothetical protein PHG05_00265 [Candidatus Nanoarchaeia archaeon]|nr:hypothetical protein [Candidatus Nanoarchaeia archaeon]